jgi:5-methyltetrahydropteroyltriglutamate--homocysteine methyltransferase
VPATAFRRPYRADQVGSHLRPDRLMDARARHQSGAISAQDLRAVEDDCIREVVALQEDLGLPCVTDGELRRCSWSRDFIAGFDNVVERPGNLKLFHRNPDGSNSETQVTGWAVTGKIRRNGPIQVDDFKFLKSIAKATAKTCIPSPTLLHFRGGREAIDRNAYPDIEMFFADAASAYRDEIDDLYAAGARYIQLDDTNLAYLCDARVRAALKTMREDPVALTDIYCRLINAAIAGRPDDLLVTIHLCRGNSSTGGAATGGYEMIGERMFSSLDVDAFFLEYDDERSGSFDVLCAVPANKSVVLGLITTKRVALERKDELKRRIDAASKFVPLERLALSPQCGFASGATKQMRMGIEDEKAKIRLLVETAHEVWGEL